MLARNGYSDLEDDVNYYPTPDGYARRLIRHGFQVQQIALIPRPTALPDTGMEGWLRTFRRGVLDSLPESVRNTAPALRDEDGDWTADYIRLRFIATA